MKKVLLYIGLVFFVMVNANSQSWYWNSLDDSNSAPSASGYVQQSSSSSADFSFVNDSDENIPNIKLLTALERNDDAAVESSLSGGASCNISFRVSGKTMTPLHYAVENCSTEIIRLLVNEGARKSSTNSNGYTPFTLAVNLKKSAAVQFFVSNKWNANEKDKNGKTPLMYAIEQGDSSLCSKMIANCRPSELSVRDNRGRTALHYAVNGGWLKIAYDLVESGMDNTIEDSDGYTAFMRSLDRGTNMMDVFLENRHFNVNRQNSSGIPPLHWAIKNGKSMTVIRTILSDNRCTVYAKDSRGKDAIDYQQLYQSSNKDLKKLLKAHR